MQRVSWLITWLPGLSAAVGFALGWFTTSVHHLDAGVVALIFWFGTVIFLLYRGATYCLEAVVSSHDKEDEHESENMKRVSASMLDSHRDLLHPGLWVMWIFFHMLVFAVAVFGMTLLRYGFMQLIR